MQVEPDLVNNGEPINEELPPNRGSSSIDGGNSQTLNYNAPKVYVQMQRGEIMQELERLRKLATHKQHLEEIKHHNPRGKIK